ncbi:MAG: T9SS type A sorting domain-containing protein [Ignavibacteria bacterium]
MNKLKLFVTIFFTVFFTTEIYSTIHTVTASGLSFTPPLLNATVGDTVKWQWVDGIHTTTSTSIPSGATTWDAPLNTTNPTFLYRLGVAGTYVYQCTFHFTLGMVGGIIVNPIGIKIESSEIPKDYELFQNYPNPFNPTTIIRYGLAEKSHVNLEVFDLLGQRVAVLLDGEQEAGYHSVLLESNGLASGLYFYRLQAGNFVGTKKLIVLR